MMKFKPEPTSYRLVLNEPEKLPLDLFTKVSLFVPHVRIEERGVGQQMWAIVHMGEVLNRDGVWEFEPSPSNRSAAFIRRTRYASVGEALEAFTTSINEQVP